MPALSGMKDICDYIHRSEATVLEWIRVRGLPATKLGGIWESDSDLIDQWKKGMILSDSNHKKEVVKPKKQ